jgi:hypothetical protein
MRNIFVCVLNQDEGWAKAFLRTVALNHPGFSVTLKFSCGECGQAYDVCLDPNGAGVPGCVCAFVPVCGSKAGAAALLAEAKAFAVTRATETAKVPDSARGDFSFLLRAGEPDGSRVVCVSARAGGAGTSCAAIGIGREFARYRDVRACYLCLTDLEYAGLLPESCASAMPPEALLYRCLRLASRQQGRQNAADETKSAVKSLLQAALIPDEYGLLRLGVDTNLNTLSALTAPEIAGFLALMDSAIGPAYFVLDFGTRLRLLDEFCEICAVKTFEIAREGDSAIPDCPEDIRRSGDRIDVALANAFGLKIKELCDAVLPTQAGISR